MVFDPIYILFIAPAFLLGLWAQTKLKRTYSEYLEVPARSGFTGAEVANAILAANRIRNVRVELVEGFLSDHYSPGEKVLRLSPDNYYGRSIAAQGVAAHEVGHAIQDQVAYKPLLLRQTVAPVAAIGSNLAWILLLVGFLLQSFQLLVVGVVLFSGGVLFTLITLPVEYDASRRAKESLVATGLIGQAERPHVERVLSAAALTYVAAAIMAIAQLLYFVFRLMLISRGSE